MSFELLEHRLNPNHREDILSLHKAMPNLPVESPQPQYQKLNPEIVLPVLNKVTGVAWFKKDLGDVPVYITAAPLSKRDDASQALRWVLRCSNRDLPDFKSGASKQLAIPQTYIDGSNFGMLAASESDLRIAFGRGTREIRP
jgi:hypothetical protein